MRAVAVVPAYRSESTIGETVRSLIETGAVDEVIVVDDGSRDATAARAAAAGARVVRLPANAGKGGALQAGISAAGRADAVLFVDADTGATASAAAGLLEPIREGAADMVIGVLPPAGGRGGFGLVRRAAAALIAVSSGYRTLAPLSGQRAVRTQVLDACRPLARGFGVDSALTADAVRLGFRIVELPVRMGHADRGRSLAGFAHRGSQGWALVRAFAPRLLARRAGGRRQAR